MTEQRERWDDRTKAIAATATAILLFTAFATTAYLFDRGPCKDLEPGTPATAVDISTAAGTGYQPQCVAITNGGSVTLVHTDSTFHNPASHNRPDGHELARSCFDYESTHGWAKMAAGATWTLTFKHWGGGHVTVESDTGHEWTCQVTERDGRAIIPYGCTDHWTIAHGWIVVA